MEDPKKNCQPCNEPSGQKSAHPGQSSNNPKGASGQSEKKGQSSKNLGSETGRSDKSASSREEHENH